MDGEDVPLVVNRATASLLSPAFLSKYVCRAGWERELGIQAHAAWPYRAGRSGTAA